MIRSMLLISVTAAFLAVIPGCIAIGGSDRTTPPTLGRQLMDLKTACDQGALTKAEYDEAKTALLSRPHSLAQRR